jgi:hypothetical protein
LRTAGRSRMTVVTGPSRSTRTFMTPSSGQPAATKPAKAT